MWHAICSAGRASFHESQRVTYISLCSEPSVCYLVGPGPIVSHMGLRNQKCGQNIQLCLNLLSLTFLQPIFHISKCISVAGKSGKDTEYTSKVWLDSASSLCRLDY